VQTDELSGLPKLTPQRTLVVVGAVLLMLGLLGALAWLYQTRIALTGPEQRWVSSQQASASTSKSSLGDETVLTLRRSRCVEGFCPAYEVTIYGSGRVEFRGQAFVCEKAPPAGKVDPQSVKRLVDGLRAVEFLKMPSHTLNDVTDAPTSVVILKQGTSAHAVEHYHGDLRAPRLLTWIEDRIDEVANTSAWIGVREGSRLVCTQPDGTLRVVDIAS
jgi:hypothetical protein